MKADMTASRDSVELLLYLIYYGLSQGLRLEDGTYSSTLEPKYKSYHSDNQ